MRRLLVWTSIVLPIMAAAYGAEIEHTRISFEHAGRKIRMEMYAPTTGGRLLTVILLHGAGGWLMDGPMVRRVARAIATQGCRTFCLRYFDQTGTLFARGDAISEGFGTWRDTLNAGVNMVADRIDVDSRRLALFGYSLGGYLAFAQAAHDRRVGAVVAFAGAIPEDRIADVQRLPPVLILHGSEDARVAVGNASRVEALLRGLEVPYEKQIYAGEGHVLSRRAQDDLIERTRRFLREYL